MPQYSRRTPGWSRWKHALSFAATLALAPALSCGQQQQPAAREMSTAESEQARQALKTWLECEECQEGELAAVTKYGDAIVPSLIAVLNQGLSPAGRERLRLDLEARHDELAARAQHNQRSQLTASKEEFTALYLSNLDAQYRVRAAQALAQIDGPRARSALEAVVGKTPRADVDSVVRALLRTMK